MAWLDVITPIPQTLISDDERRQGVNRGFLTAAVLILVFLFIYWFFKDLAGVSDAQDHPILLILLELSKVLAGFIMYLVVCWSFKLCVYVFTLKTENPKDAEDITLPEKDISESEPPAIKDICEEGTPPQFFSNLYRWISLGSNRKGPQLAYLYYALSQHHILKDPKPKTMLDALVNTYSSYSFAKETSVRHACSAIKNRPEGREKKNDQERIAAIYNELTGKTCQSGQNNQPNQPKSQPEQPKQPGK